MEYLPLIGTVFLIHFLGLISPGPDFIMAIKNSLSYSRKTGIYTAIGFGLGLSVHILYCIAGIATIISQSILVFNVIKFLGAGYLIYIGVMSLLAKPSAQKIEKQKTKKDISPFKAIKIGFLTNLLNPKVTIFFLSLFSLIITPETPSIVLGIISILMIVNTALWFSCVAIFFTQPKIRKAFSNFESIFNKIFGTLLIGLGIKIGLSQK